MRRFGRLGGMRAAAVALLGALALLAAGCGRGDLIAAEVGGARYTVADLHDHLAAGDRAVVARSEAAEWLSDWVWYAAIEMELADRGVDVTDDHEALAADSLVEENPSFVPDAAGGALRVRQRAVALAAGEWIEAEAGASVGVAEGGALRHLCSRHILLASQAEADQVLERLGAGEPFDALALELSQDPGSGPLGGDLGCVLEGSFVAPYEEAAYAAVPKEVVTAETRFGFHVIEVLSSGPATAENHPDLDAAALERMSAQAAEAKQAARLRAGRALQQQLQQQFVIGTIERFADQVSIHDRYGHWDPSVFQVVLEPPV